MRFAALLALSVVATTPALADAPDGPAPHRARYDVFDEQGTRVGSTEFSAYGSACSGFATEALTELAGGLHDEHMTYEPSGGASLEFSDTTVQGGRQLTDVHGNAKRADGGVDVTVDDSGHGKVTEHFDGDVEFPVAYDRRVLAAAVAGKAGLLTAHVVDGHSAADRRPVTVSTTVAPVPAADGAPDALRGLRAFRVTSRFFPPGQAGGEAEHIVSELEYENGVSTEVVDTTGGHVLTMQLAALEMVPQSGCKPPRR